MSTNSHSPKPIAATVRATSLDALRGYAILTMVLSATIAYGVLPAWMYHAQEPPPTHEYFPLLSGLTWVDLVFPFFLFAMGAAFPFSIGKKLEKGGSRAAALGSAFTRMLKLAFFAILIQHFYSYMLSDVQGPVDWLLSISCFALLFPMFMRIPLEMPKWAHMAIQIGAFVVAAVLMCSITYAGGKKFEFDGGLYISNIIILLLANMAFFGAAIYIFTFGQWWPRVVAIITVAAMVLSAGVEGSWVSNMYKWTPCAWLFHFEYLRYLLIVIPGSMVGDMLRQWMSNSQAQASDTTHSDNIKAVSMIALSLAIIITGLIGLQSRQSFLTFVIVMALVLSAWLVCRKGTGSIELWRRITVFAAALFVIGFFCEPFQGGIKKDGPTFSYLLLTSAMASMALIFFHVICDYFKCHRSTKFLVMSGQNPMVAYVACDLLIYPLFKLLGILGPMFNFFAGSPWLGFLQGLVFTSLALLVTMFFTRIKWFWRT